MSEKDLELLVTLDDPWSGPDEDPFHLQPEHSLADAWLAHEIVRTTLPKVSFDSSRR
jgi:hypothetical protein